MSSIPKVSEPARPRLWLVRHGETRWAAEGRHTSTTDVPLTARGRAQAVALASSLAGHAFGAILSSPMRRALETCRLAGFGDRATIDADLAEWAYGADEGRTTAQIRRDRPGWSIWRDGPLEGETIEHVAGRADHLIARARSTTGDTLCFGHGHQLRILAARWVGLAPAEGRLLLLEPASISILGWERETAVIERWNQPAEALPKAARG